MTKHNVIASICSLFQRKDAVKSFNEIKAKTKNFDEGVLKKHLNHLCEREVLQETRDGFAVGQPWEYIPAPKGALLWVHIMPKM